ncbi:hypothetical protein [Mesorhizobium sp.]|uniref:hypothetical protein n=1 Tax=Mesorhizobium sp. TaxID=1871066 RepID=UPI000FE85221|nr:hypothetical protein [Mesorhizobium sp.]RWE00274.1 MAG: hypothetical protein EOS40_16285 [Mesorhizobium sp.]TIT97241.1 MAG: hypothetical protein E5W55_09400 [Mesorhizobium sp.]
MDPRVKPEDDEGALRGAKPKGRRSIQHASSGRFAATFSHKGRREEAFLPVLMELETENAVH